MSSIIETGIDYGRINDTKYMRSYLMRLNDDLKYMLTNLSEDNFDPVSLSTWQKFGDSIINLDKTAERLTAEFSNALEEVTAEVSQRAESIDLCLTKGNVTAALNVSTDAIRISAARLQVISDNFTLDGSNLKISGEIHANAGSIGGFSISKENGKPYFDGGSSCTVTGGTLEGTNGHFGSFTCAGSSSTDRSEMELGEAYVNMRNCDITCTGAVMDGSIDVYGDLNVAVYNYDADSYSGRYWIYLYGDADLVCDDIVRVEKRANDGMSISNRGYAYCYSFIASDGVERSDARLKMDIETLDESMAAEFINRLRPVSFNFIDDEDKDRMLGLIAQEVMALQDEYGDFGLIDQDEETGYYSLCYEHLTAFMAAAMKDIERRLHDGSG